VLGLYPARDGALTEAQMAGSAAFIEDAPRRWRYARLEGSGHWPQRDAPEALAQLITGFLGDCGPEAGGSGGGGSSRGQHRRRGGPGGNGSSGGSGGGGGGAAAPRSRL
jgi:hypothetical protein